MEAGPEETGASGEDGAVWKGFEAGVVGFLGGALGGRSGGVAVVCTGGEDVGGGGKGGDGGGKSGESCEEEAHVVSFGFVLL